MTHCGDDDLFSEKKMALDDDALVQPLLENGEANSTETSSLGEPSSARRLGTCSAFVKRYLFPEVSTIRAFPLSLSLFY